MGYGFWAMGYGLWVMGYGLWVMGYGLWVMGYGLWVMRRKELLGFCPASGALRTMRIADSGRSRSRPGRKNLP